jgi:c(7)-type cytochrome triheme protein
VRSRSARLTLALLGLASLAMTAPPPHTYGRVVLDNFSRRAGVLPVGFDHWRHRARFTCRLCHVDIGFAMSAGETKTSASTNQRGFHCGACHNGKTSLLGKTVFPSCDASQKVEQSATCRRCHARADPAKLQADYDAFAKGMPQDRFGNVDWEKAESSWLVKPVDFVAGVSSPRTPLKMNKEISIESRGTWMTDVTFSHKKHAVWIGCEVCHPEIFPSTKNGPVKYSMLQITNGESCGVCHQKVAFHLADCEKCHVNPVR